MPRFSGRKPLFLLLASLFLLGGCSRKSEPSSSTPLPAQTESPQPPPSPTETPTNTAVVPQPVPSPAPAPAPAPVPVPPVKGEVLRLLLPAWQNPAWLPEALEQATGAKIEIKAYANDAELLAELQNPAAAVPAEKEKAWDLVAVSDRAAAVLIPAGRLLALSADAQAMGSKPAPEFLHHYFDPKSEYTWPYGWTLLGFATPIPDSAHPAPALKAWRDLAKEGLGLSLPEDPALRQELWVLENGHLPGAPDPLPPEWQKASYDPTPAIPNAPGAPEKAWVEPVAKLLPLLSRPNERWQVTLPDEGSLIFLYHWAIPAGAPRPALSEAALRILTAPATAARLDSESGLGATQPEARRLLPPAAQADHLVYPAEHLLDGCRFVRTK